MNGFAGWWRWGRGVSGGAAAALLVWCAGTVWVSGCAAGARDSTGRPSVGGVSEADAGEKGIDDLAREGVPETTGRSARGTAGTGAAAGVDERGGAGAAPDAPAVTTEPWSFGETAGQTIRTANYRIYTTDRDEMLVRLLPAFLEGALVQYRGSLVDLPAPRQKLDTYLMGSRSDWEVLTRQLMGEKAGTYLRIDRGGFSSEGMAVLFNIGRRDTMSVAAHEGWHQYTQRTFEQQLPIWLEEGVATYMEGHRWVGGEVSFRPWGNPERYNQLRWAVRRGRVLSLAELLEATPQELLEKSSDGTLDYYAQVWALVHFLNEGEGGKYQAGLQALLRDAASGRLYRAVGEKLGMNAGRSAARTRRGPGVFMAYFSMDMGAAQEEYAAFLEAVTDRGARGSISAGRSPLGARAPSQ